MTRLSAFLLLTSLPLFAEDPLPQGALQRFTYPGGVGDVQFSPDGKTLAAGGFDKTIRLYETGQYRLLFTLKGHTGRVTCLGFSPDGKTLASGSDDGSVRFWEVASGNPTGTLAGIHSNGTHGTGTTSLGYLPDGKSIFTTGYDPVIHTWDVASLSEIRSISGHDDCVVANLSADGKVLVSASQDGTGKAWNPATGDAIGDLEIQPAIEAQSPHLGYPVFSHDGHLVFSGAGDGRIRTWTLPGLKPGPVWQAHGGFTGAIDVSPDNAILVTGGMHPLGGLGAPDSTWDNAIRFWDPSTGEKLLELDGHSMSVNRTRFSPDGTRLVSCSWDGSILLWDLEALDLVPGKAAEIDVDAVWTSLAMTAGPKPWRAIRAAVAKPDKAIEMLGERLEPAKVDPDFAQKLAQLILDLDDDDFKVRDKAQAALAHLGPRAEAALRKALEAPPSAEVRMRAREILENKSAWKPATREECRWVNATKILSQIGGDKASALLEKLASGDPDAALTALAKSALTTVRAK